MTDHPNPAPPARVLAFFAITFAVSWALWLLPLLRSNGVGDLPEIVGLLGMFAPFGPSVAAFWLVARADGREGFRSLWRRGWRLDFDKRWLVPTLGLVPLVGLVNVLIVLALGEEIEWDVGIGAVMVVPIFAIIYLGNALPEEYGWRGYALDPLLGRFGPLGASVALGLVWGLWHLPLVFIEGTTQAAIPFHEFVLQTVVLAVLYTWLHRHTGGSVLIAALFHASANTTGAALPTWTTPIGRWVNFGLLLLVAVPIVWSWRRAPGTSVEP